MKANARTLEALHTHTHTNSILKERGNIRTHRTYTSFWYKKCVSFCYICKFKKLKFTFIHFHKLFIHRNYKITT